MTEEEKLQQNIKNILLDFYANGGPLDEWILKINIIYREAGYKSPEYWKEKWDASEHYKD